MISFNEINHLHVELTTACNAHCPACGRNNGGFGLKDGFKIRDLPFERFIEICDTLPNLRILQLCGNLGDPLAAKRIMDVVDEAIKRNLVINIHTNGSLKTTDWWRNLGEKLYNTKHAIIFGIDGLEDTHSIHRQGTSFTKIIENAKSFIDKGGNAEWRMLMFKHNQHQVKDCLKLSQQLGFKKFYTRKSVRLPDVARHYQTGEPYLIERADNFIPLDLQKTLEPEDCFHLQNKSIFVDASGFISACCNLSFLHKKQKILYDDNTLDTDIINGNAGENCRKFCSGFHIKNPNNI